MKDVTYRCNLCNDKHSPENLYGLYWQANDELLLHAANATEHHVCIKCVDAIKKFPKKVLTASTT